MAKLLIIADSGATKADWYALDQTTGNSLYCETPGINGISSDSGHIDRVLAQLKTDFGTLILENKNPEIEIYFYGAGFVGQSSVNKLKNAFLKAFGNNLNVQIESDMLGAARALLGNQPGIACILGTGSNTAFYDGNCIKNKIPSLGYILGDEGSGAALGKRLLNRYFKGPFSDGLISKLNDNFNLSMEFVLENVYRKDNPNSYLASFVPFIRENLYEYPELKELTYCELKLFFERNICRYPEIPEIPVCMTGSVAFFFREEIRHVAAQYNIKVNQIERKPINGLVDYHLLQATCAKSNY